MVAFVFSIIFLILGAGALIFRAFAKVDTSSSRNEKDSRSVRRGATLVASLLLVIGFTILVFDSFTIVPARNVGIVVTFGKAEQTLNNGFHWVKPWSTIEKVDGTVQNINLDSDTHNCITVRLANQTTACIDLTLQWNLDQQGHANDLWQRYRGKDGDVIGHVGKNVVERELIRALGNVFKTYNPLTVLTDPTSKQPSADDLAKAALTQVQESVDPGIVVSTLLIPTGGVHYDDVTQQKLNAFAQALADTQIATQNKLTAEQQKLANDLLAAASSNDPGVKYQNCLNLMKDLAAKNQLQNLPQTFNCSESGTPVIIGGK